MITTPSGNRLESIEEQGNPLDDLRAFRRALGQFATGVTVVTSNTSDYKVGMTVNSFASVSLDPPLVSWSIRKESQHRETFTQGEHFAVSVLAEDQVDLCSVFGRPQEKQFDTVSWTESIHGDPLLDNAIAHFECKVEAVYPGGDHDIIIGRVERYTRLAGTPLVFSQGQYRVAFDHPQLDGTSASQNARVNSDDQTMFASLLKTTERHLSDAFQEYREELDLSVAAGRIINILDVSPSSIQQLSEGALMGFAAVEDAVRDLKAKDLISGSSQGPYVLTNSGRYMRQALLSRAQELNERLTSQIDPTDLATARRVLMQLLSS